MKPLYIHTIILAAALTASAAVKADDCRTGNAKG